MTTYTNLVATRSPMRLKRAHGFENRVQVYRLTKDDLPFTFAEGDVEVRIGTWPNGACGQLHRDTDGVCLFNKTGYRGQARNGSYFVWKEPRDV